MLYRIVVHAALAGDEDGVLARLREVLEANGLEITVLTAHEAEPDGGRVLHVESAIEAPSGYHASAVSGPELFARLLEEAGLPTDRDAIMVEAQRPA